MSIKQPALLIVDDNEKNLYSLKKILNSIDIDIHTALSGEQTLQALLNHDFFLIFMAVKMPRMDGIETVSIMRRNDRYKHIPVIFVIANSQDQKRVTSSENEAAIDYIFKPILDSEPVISKVNIYLNLFLTQLNNNPR